MTKPNEHSEPGQPLGLALTEGLGRWWRKRSGSQWQGRVVGEYSTTLTPEGYAVESDTHAGSVQIYPAALLELVEHRDEAQRTEA